MVLPAGATIGILGGGQLGRMLASAATGLGFDVHIYCPDADCPAGRVAARLWQHGYDDTAALADFARACDVVTVEFENVPVAAADAVISAGTPFHPGPKALAVAQDRATEKKFLQSCGIECAPWVTVDSLDDLASAHRELGPDAILKTRRDGYDGKGQVRLSANSDLSAAWDDVGNHPCVLEGFVPFELEISAIVARRADGAFAGWSPSLNIHETGILRRSVTPAPVDQSVRDDARDLAIRLASALDYVGVLALELFVLPGGDLLANEFAPRVHNSGHWTPEACATGQFETHIRAIAGWPLGDTARLFNAEMVNLLGDEALIDPIELRDGVSLTLYGKREARPGRKMGHTVRRLGPAGD
ncbi:MAG: 5-(carboxyamino)imidazole ribonucleotide synthase [Pseudomonadota bacterium]